jgi:hypothetical protein
MTIRELIELFIDEQEFTIYDSDYEKNVFTGYIDELPDEYEYKEVSSIDNLNGTEILTINV